MHVLRSSSNRGFQPSEWGENYRRSPDRKRNATSRTDCRLLPRIKASSALPIGTSSSVSFDTENDRLLRCQNKKDRKFAARKHLIGSLSAPLKSSSCVKTSLVSRSERPTKLYTEYFSVAKSFDSPPGSQHLKTEQDTEKSNHRHPPRLDLTMKIQDPSRMLPSRMAATPIHQEFRNDHINAQRMFYLTSDVARLSQVLGQNSDDNGCSVHNNGNQFNIAEYGKFTGLKELKHRPLTPNLMKKLDKMKLSSRYRTEEWIKQLPKFASSYMENKNNMTNLCPEKTALTVSSSWLYNDEL